MKNRALVPLFFKTLTLVSFVLININTKGQAVDQKIAFTSEQTDNHVIKEFSVKEMNNKLYFKFLILENLDQTNYMLESSANGIDFHPVQSKQGFKSPTGVPLLYCYTVDLTTLNDHIYRIKRISSDGEVYSSIIELDDNDLVFSSEDKNPFHD